MTAPYVTAWPSREVQCRHIDCQLETDRPGLQTDAVNSTRDGRKSERDVGIR